MNNIEKETNKLWTTDEDICSNCGKDGLPWPQTTDAKIWADEFCTRNSASDHGTMHAWFANAIMVGYDTQHKKLEPKHSLDPEYKVCCSNFEECTGLCIPRATHWKNKYVKTKSLYDNLKRMIDNLIINNENH